MNQLGLSLYLGSGKQTNLEVIAKAKKANMKYAFTSLHIPEESISDYKKETLDLLQACNDANLSLMIDVGPRTLEKLGMTSLYQLKQYGIQYLRIDYGFSVQEITDLMHDFHIVLNASTLTPEELEYLRQSDVDLTKIVACHNFYPKPLTALSMNLVREINERLHQYGIKTVGFVSGDSKRRGPLFSGLPTVEEHRDMDVLRQVLELKHLGHCDMIMIGDIDVSDRAWKQLEELQSNYVTLRANIHEAFAFVCDIIHHDRVDYSSYVIRSVESREYKHPSVDLANRERKLGSISMSNAKYLRYEGELEIARCDLPEEEKVTIIGNIIPNDIAYLSLIHSGMGFRIVKESIDE